MSLSPLLAFTIMLGLCAMAIGHTLHQSGIERQARAELRHIRKGRRVA